MVFSSGRKDIRDALADSLKSSQPRLYALLEEAVKRGQTKRQIMAQIRSAVAGRFRVGNEGQLTFGCCEAVIDRLIEAGREEK